LRNRPGIDLLVVVGVTLLLILVVIFSPSNIPRVVLGLPFILFLPGYTLISALFPSRSQLSTIERVAYSLALSIAIVALIGLLLNYVWYIGIYPLLISVSLITLVLAVIAWLRRRNLPENQKDFLRFKINFNWNKIATFDKILYCVLILVVIGAVVVSIHAYNKNQEEFTEFYLLGPSGKAEDYPQNLDINQQGELTLIVANHENKDTNYTIKVIPEDCTVWINGVEQYELNLSLANNQQLSYNVTFVFNKAGNGKKLEFDLYNGSGKTVYLNTYVRVKVTVK